MDNGHLKSLLLNQAMPTNLLQQENVTDFARMVSILSQQNFNGLKCQNDVPITMENYRNFLSIPKQPFDQLHPVNLNGMFNFFPQFQTPFNQAAYMSPAPLNLSSSASRVVLPINKPLHVKIEETHTKPENCNDISNNSMSIKKEMTTTNCVPQYPINQLSDSFENAPFGRSKNGKPLKRPGFVPSYMERDSGPFLCIVCKKEASGLHYKAMTCEGCKGFFRRTIQQNLIYECKFAMHCDVNRRTKKDVCRRCRWERCLKSGMAKNSVLSDDERKSKNELIKNNKLKRARHEPDHIRDNYRHVYPLDVSNTESFKSDEDSNRDDTTSFISDVSRTSSNSEMADLIKSLLAVYHAANVNTNIVEKIRYLIDNIPGFEKITPCEKYGLLKNKGLQCFLLLSVYTFSDNKDFMQAPNGSIISKNVLKNSEDNIVAKFWNFAENTDFFDLNKSEKCVLFVLVLLVNYNSFLATTDELDSLEAKYLNALHLITTDNIRRGKILLFVFPELAKMAEHVRNCSIEGHTVMGDIHDQLHTILNDISAENHQDFDCDEALPLIIKVD